MLQGPHASLAVEPPAVRGGLLAALIRRVLAPLVRGLRRFDPMWPRGLPPHGQPDARLLDHLAG